MSLYYEAADILSASLSGKGSIQSLVFSNKTLKNKPGQLFALLSEASKWSPVLKGVIEQSGVLSIEKKLTPTLALLLTHDLLLAKSGVAAPAAHPLRVAISRHKARLSAELTKIRIKRGHGSLADFKASIESTSTEASKRIRWVRVNTIKSSLDDLSTTLLRGYKPASSLQDVLNTSSADDKRYWVDEHVPNLLALPSTASLLKSLAYTQGHIILQDKASCFPAALLGAVSPGETIIDGCAAPGNKTTHLAALCADSSVRVIAFEKDKTRALTLQKMVDRAGASKRVSVKAGKDFLASDPESDEFRTVSALLLDPSCSGSGIIGRDDVVTVELPGASALVAQKSDGRSRKRKRGPTKETVTLKTQVKASDEAGLAEEEPLEAEDLKSRLEGLAKFQLQIIKHAMKFPAATKITYSTCSVHATENEEVVLGALTSDVARTRGWRIWTREAQPSGMAAWPRRGSSEAFDDGIKARPGAGRDQDTAILANACIRCCKDTDEGTMGFFLAGFLRDGDAASFEEEEEEWSGFSDEDG